MRTTTGVGLARVPWWAAGAACGLAGAPAVGQQHAGVAQIEQIWADANPLSVSLHRPPDRISPITGFDGVFRDPAEPGKLFRYDNGITAVFDASEYAIGASGNVVPLIPAGTIFRLGPRPRFGFGSATPPAASLLSPRVPALRAPTRAGVVPVGPTPPAAASEALTMWTSESVRRDRVSRLFGLSPERGGAPSEPSVRPEAP